MIPIIMNDYEIDGRTSIASASANPSLFGIETPQKTRVSEGAAAEMRSDGGNGDIDVGKSEIGCLRAVECEGIRVSSGIEMETRVSESEVGDVDFDGRNGIFGVGKSEIECEDVEIRDSKVKVEDLRFNDGNGSELGCGEIERKTEARVSKVKANDLQFSCGNGYFDGGNEGKEGLMVMSEEVRFSECGSSNSVLHDESAFETSEMVLDRMKGLSYRFETGDMVWGKVKSHPWWPGHIFNEAFASVSVRRMRHQGHVLVAFFGDSSYGWFDPTELIPFEPSYAEKSRQTNSRTLVRAVEEAVDELSRRRALGLACRCRNPFNFRPASVQGYFAVDVLDYEPGGVYSGKQIEKVRDSFRPVEALSFVQQLALMPHDGDHRSIDWIMNVAVVLAYRKAVFEEFDETYAQAFGMEPVRPSRNAFGELEQPDRVLPRAPLSGPLVIAETLGERKSSGKSLKVKDSSKKDTYLFKRRDEPNEKRVAKQGPNRASQLQTNAVPSLSFKEASAKFPSEAGDYILQKRGPAVPEMQPIPAEQEQREIASQECGVPITKSDSVEAQTLVVLPTVRPVDFPTSQPPAFGRFLPMQGRSEEGKQPIGSVTKEMDASAEMTGRMKSDETVRTSSILANVGKSESLIPVDGAGKAVGKEVEAVIVEGSHEQGQVMGDSSIRSLSVFADGPIPGGVLVTPSGIVVVGKTTEALKRSVREDLSTESSVVGEKKKKKKKKNGPGLESSLDHQQKRPKFSKDVEALRKMAGKSIGISSFSQEHPLMDTERNDGISSDSGILFPKLDVVNVELELPQLVNDLLTLALDPFHAIERNSPALVRHVFLKFRSLVYQKSLILPPASESEASEPGATKSVVGRSMQESNAGNAELGSTVGGREASASKSVKHASRLDDPTKAGRKRSPSDRQEEMSAKRLKKLKEMKLLAMGKKTSSQKTPDGPKGEQKETGTAPLAQAKPAMTDPVKKPELPSKATKPTAIVMKFPPKTTLPSAPQLKARFARFGPLDLSGTRVYWKSSTCRIVFKYKSDAETAYHHATRNNSLFGHVRVRYNLRELDLPASELPDANQQRIDDSPDNAPPPRPGSSDFVGEPRPSVHQQRPPPAGVQLKSCLKKSSGADEAGPAVGITKESPRVKFLLGGEDSRGEQMVVVSSNNNGSDADGASSYSVTFDLNINNIKSNVVPLPPPPLPLLSRSPDLPPRPPLSLPFLHQPSRAPDALPPTPSFLPRPPFSLAPYAHESRGHFGGHFGRAPLSAHHAHYKEVEGRRESMVDISHQMLSLLMRCSDVVTNVKSTLGYVPYHPL